LETEPHTVLLPHSIPKAIEIRDPSYMTKASVLGVYQFWYNLQQNGQKPIRLLPNLESNLQSTKSEKSKSKSKSKAKQKGKEKAKSAATSDDSLSFAKISDDEDEKSPEFADSSDDMSPEPETKQDHPRKQDNAAASSGHSKHMHDDTEMSVSLEMAQAANDAELATSYGDAFSPATTKLDTFHFLKTLSYSRDWKVCLKLLDYGVRIIFYLSLLNLMYHIYRICLMDKVIPLYQCRGLHGHPRHTIYPKNFMARMKLILIPLPVF
jgi:hypothetical protein